MDLPVVIRKELGKSATKRFLKEEFIPAELYGHGLENLHLLVGRKEFQKLFKAAGESTIFNLRLEKETRPVLIHEIEKDALSGDVRHIDFYQVKMDEEIRTHVPFRFEGEAPAIKEKKGNLNKSLTEIEVEVLPAHLPHEFVVDITSLDEVDKAIHIKDIVIPKQVKVLMDPETVIISVVPLVKEEEVVPVVSVADVEVESELKKAERDEKKEEKKDK